MDLSSSAPAQYAMMFVVILTLLASSGVALGQEGTAGQNNLRFSGASGAVKPPTIDDATLKRTAKAFVKIKRILVSAQREIDRSNSDQQKQQIVAQAESDKIDAVKAEGLRPQQYNQVLVLARVDKTLRQKLLSYVNEVEKTPQKAE
jgi:Domain of unknown function (DUF4168)